MLSGRKQARHNIATQPGAVAPAFRTQNKLTKDGIARDSLLMFVLLSHSAIRNQLKNLTHPLLFVATEA